MSEEKRREYAGRIAKGDAGVAHEIAALKGPDRQDIVSELVAWKGGGIPRAEPSESDADVLHALVGSDYVRGLRTDGASKRIATLLKAAKLLGGAAGEAVVISILLQRGAAAAEEIEADSIEPETIIAGSRLERCSPGGLTRALAESRVRGFHSLALWTRLAAISTATAVPPEEAARMAEAIDSLVTQLGPASNVVPPEIIVLRRGLAASGSSAEPVTRDQTTHPGPSNDATRDPARMLENLAELAQAVASRLHDEHAAAGQDRIELARRREELQKAEQRAMELQMQLRSSGEALERARREAEDARAALPKVQKRAEDLEKRLHDTEALLEGASGSAARSAQRKLREQCLAALEELGQYVAQAKSSKDFDSARLSRSFERFDKIFRRATGPSQESSSEGADS